MSRVRHRAQTHPLTQRHVEDVRRMLVTMQRRVDGTP
jgi:hypothetical protein